MSINYSERIPNSVDLANDRTLQRALEHWQPQFLDWWREMGPHDSAAADVYLRTAVGVDAQGWASYGPVKMPDYRWGIFLADRTPDRTIGFGDHVGEPVWQQVPGELRSQFRRIIVTQGDTEPASVEQQHRLGLTCPSLYDLRNLLDRKSTRLNSSHLGISYAVFCLKKKNQQLYHPPIMSRSI